MSAVAGLYIVCQRDHSFASSYSSYAKKPLSLPGVSLLVYLFTATGFLAGVYNYCSTTSIKMT